jgi:hypothetical protein
LRLTRIGHRTQGAERGADVVGRALGVARNELVGHPVRVTRRLGETLPDLPADEAPTPEQLEERRERQRPLYAGTACSLRGTPFKRHDALHTLGSRQRESQRHRPGSAVRGDPC